MSQKFRMDSEGIPLDPYVPPEKTSFPGIPYSEPIPLRTLSAYTLESTIGQVRRNYVRYWFVLPKIITVVNGSQRIIDDCTLISEGSQLTLALTLLPVSAAHEIEKTLNIAHVHDRLELQTWRYRASEDNIMRPFAPIVIYDSGLNQVYPITGHEIREPVSIFKPYVIEIFTSTTILRNSESVSRNLLNPEFPNSYRQLVPLTDGSW